MYPTETAARKTVEARLMKLNSESPQAHFVTPTFRGLIDRYKDEELPQRHSTRKSYESMLGNHIEPKGGDYPLVEIKPMAVEQWFKQLELAPKTKAHIKSLMHLLFRCAERWELVEMGKNPIAWVRVKGCTKRLKKPRVLTKEEICRLLPRLSEPFRTMAIVAQCLGLRVSEIMGLQWGDFKFEDNTLLVQRSVVQGNVGEVKTEYSRDEVPLDPGLAAILLKRRAGSPFRQDEDWVFANPATGKPYHQGEIQKRHIKKAAANANLGEGIGWHTFRHTYRSWLDETGAPMTVQQELMRHASIQTTMNVYGRAMADGKRQANSKVVQMVLEPSLSLQDHPVEMEKGPLPAPLVHVN
jgi:integrase